MKTHIDALLKLRLQLLHQRLVSKSHSKCNFILNWPGKVTHITQTNKNRQHTEAKKKPKKPKKNKKTPQKHLQISPLYC